MGRLGEASREGDVGGVDPQRTGRNSEYAQARFGPLCLSEGLMEAQKRISDLWVRRDLSKSLCPIALLAGAWTSKSFGKASSCSLTQHPLKAKLAIATLCDLQRTLISSFRSLGVLGESFWMQGLSPLVGSKDGGGRSCPPILGKRPRLPIS